MILVWVFLGWVLIGLMVLLALRSIPHPEGFWMHRERIRHRDGSVRERQAVYIPVAILAHLMEWSNRTRSDRPVMRVIEADSPLKAYHQNERASDDEIRPRLRSWGRH